MTAATEDAKLVPPYAPFTTFSNFVASLKKGGIPDRIDKTVMSNYSGGMQSHLIGSLRFLDLIDADGKPTGNLKQLVAATGTDDWKDILKPIVEHAYHDIVGSLDLNTATPGQLEERFKNETVVGNKLVGSTAVKAIRFYLAALKEAQIPHSNRLAPPKQARGAKTPKSPRKNGAPTHTSNTDNAENHEDFLAYPVHFGPNRRASISVPSDVTVSEVEMISLALQMIKRYAEQFEDTQPASRATKETADSKE